MADEFRKIVEARATATLTTSYVASDSIYCLEYDFLTLLVDYTRAIAGGSVVFKLEFSLDGTVWYQTSIYDSGAVAVNVDTTSTIQREEFEYGATGAAQELFLYGPIEIDQFAKYLRISVMENGGGLGNEGDCGVTVMLTRRKQKTMN